MNMQAYYNFVCINWFRNPPFQLYSLFQPFARTGKCTQCTVVNDQSQIRYMNWYYTRYEWVQYDLQIGMIWYTNRYNTILKSVWYNIQINIRISTIYFIVFICILYRTDLNIVLYWFVYRIVPICISYHTDPYIVSYRFVYRIVPILTPF